MTTKKILFLGASAQQMPPIKYAVQQGHYVITCDYLPDNPGHKLADEWYNVSTTDMDAVLALAKRAKVDGVVAYASDPAAPTQAYVAEKWVWLVIRMSRSIFLPGKTCSANF